MKTWALHIEKGTIMNRLVLLSTCAFAAVCPSGVVYAQALPGADAINAAPLAADDIVVTARREKENLRDVPATVTVLTAKALEQTGAKVATDFIQLTSGVSIITATAEPTDTSIQIRGLNRGRDAENNVGLVIDGIIKTNSAALNQPQGALTQVEILKGPQGAIYGRNASAGAIVITTRRPTDNLEFEVKGHAATDKTFGGSALIAAPITESIGFVLSGDFDRSDGYYRNTFLGTPLARSLYPNYKDVNKTASVDNYESGNIYGRLLIKPTDETEIDIKAHGGYSRAAALTFNATFNLPALVTAFNDPILNEKVSDHKFLYTNNTAARSFTDTWDGSFKLTQDLEFAELTAYVAYSHIRAEFFGGGAAVLFNSQPQCQTTFAATAPPNVVNPEPFNKYFAAFGSSTPFAPTTCDGIQYQIRTQNDVVSELRLAGGSGPLSWQLGGSYIFIDRRVCLTTQTDVGTGPQRGQCFVATGPNRTETLQDDNFRTNVYAAFASGEYAVTDQLKLGAAVRYDIEARTTSSNVPGNARTIYVGNPATGFPNGSPTSPANYYLNPGLDPALNPSGVIAPRSRTFKQFEPKLTVGYKATPDISLFGSWGVGFRAGGFNPGGTKTIVDVYFNRPVSQGGINAGLIVNDEYKKETTSAFELGTKGRLFNVFDFELVGYHTNVRDMQFFEFLTGGFGQLRVNSNIDKVRINGIEGSLNWRIAQGVSLFGSANYTDSKIVKYSSRPYTVGNKSPGTPDYTINAGAQISRPIQDDLIFNFRTDVRIVGPTPFHAVQDNTVPTTAGVPGNYKNAIRSTYETVNARIGLEKGSWSIAAYVTNLFKKRYLDEVVPAPDFGGSFVAPGALRRFGLEAGYKF